MATKPMPKGILDLLTAHGWKPKNPENPLYTYVKENWEMDIIPGMNKEFSVQIAKMSKARVINSMRLNSDDLRELIQNPVIHY